MARVPREPNSSPMVLEYDGEYPPEAGPIQLTVRIDVFSDELSPQRGWPWGGCAVTFEAPEGSRLVKKYWPHFWPQ